jgi:hypothetical protein
VVIQPRTLRGFFLHHFCTISAPFLHYTQANVDPSDNDGKPRNGDVRYADGTNWNPGGTGEGIYAYTDDAWAKL